MGRENTTRLKGAFEGCSWCHGRGCMGCDQERAKAIERAGQPILSVTHEELADPSLGPLIRDAIGAEALQRAFGPGGGGVQEIKANCALVSLTQALRKRKETTEETDGSQ